MINKKENLDLNKLFKENKFDIPDNGFSRDTIRKLPIKTNLLPFLIMIICIAIGVAIAISLQDIDVVTTNVVDLFTAVASLQIPSVASIVTYLVGVSILCSIGFSVSQGDTR